MIARRPLTTPAMLSFYRLLAHCPLRLLRAVRGFLVHFENFGEPLDADPQRAATQINAAMERLIRRCPQQYLWGYGRYKKPRGQPA